MLCIIKLFVHQFDMNEYYSYKKKEINYFKNKNKIFYSSFSRSINSMKHIYLIKNAVKNFIYSWIKHISIISLLYPGK
jgi:hypothetical protein